MGALTSEVLVLRHRCVIRKIDTRDGRCSSQVQAPEWFSILWQMRPTKWRVKDPAGWIAEVEEDYSDLDIRLEARKARRWMLDKPSRAPKKNLATFFNSWLSRARGYANAAAGRRIPSNPEGDGDGWEEAAKRSGNA